jgi:hypothetical protein
MEVGKMKFLCLAYGNEAAWNALSESEKRDLLAQDVVIRERGNLMAAVRTEVTTIRNWGGKLEVKEEADTRQPLVGFSVIEAGNVREVIALVADTPCARARGYIEIRRFWDSGHEDA